MDNEPRLREPEASAAAALRSLARDPSPEARARILAAVRVAAGEGSPSWTRPVVRLRRRIVLGAAACLAALAAGGSTAVVASADALPGSPAYGLRSVNERVRLLFAAAPEQERLRLSFSERRLQQARQEWASGDRGDAATLLHDGTDYLQQAEAGLNELGQSQRPQIVNQLNSVKSDEHQLDGQLQQTGNPGQQNHDGSGSSPSQGSQSTAPAGSTGGQPSAGAAGSGAQGPSGASESNGGQSPGAGANQTATSGPAGQNP